MVHELDPWQMNWLHDVLKRGTVRDYSTDKHPDLKIIDWKPDNIGMGVFFIVNKPGGRGRKPKGYVPEIMEIYKEFPSEILSSNRVTLTERLFQEHNERQKKERDDREAATLSPYDQGNTEKEVAI